MSDKAKQPTLDALGRPSIADVMKAQIAAAFSVVPKDKRAAVLIIADTDTGIVRGHLAARVGDEWKVAAGGGFNVPEKRPFGFVGVERTW